MQQRQSGFRRPSGFLRAAGEMVSIVLLALTGRFIGFAQSTLESRTPLSVDKAFNYVADTRGVFVRPDRLALLLAVLSVAAVIRIGIAHANRSFLILLKARSGIEGKGLSSEHRAVRLPVTVLYRVDDDRLRVLGVAAHAEALWRHNEDESSAAFMGATLSGLGAGFGAALNVGPAQWAAVKAAGAKPAGTSVGLQWARRLQR